MSEIQDLNQTLNRINRGGVSPQASVRIDLKGDEATLFTKGKDVSVGTGALSGELDFSAVTIKLGAGVPPLVISSNSISKIAITEPEK